MTDIIMFFSRPEMTPFSVALLLMLLIGAISVIGIDFEVGAEVPSIDADIDHGAGEATGFAMIDWVNPGRLPMLAALALFLMIYSLIGLAGQQFLESRTGMLPAWIAALTALPAAYILWQPTSRIVGRIIPRDHTDAVSVKSLQGRRGVIEIGTATYKRSARAVVQDAFGTRHNVMVRMSLPDQEAHADDEVYLLEIGINGEPSIAAPAETRTNLTI